MERRSFMGLLGGLGPALTGEAATSDRKRTSFYVVWDFDLKNGTQPARAHDYLSNGFIPSVRQLSPGPVIALEAVVAAHMPRVTLIMGFNSLEEIGTVHSKVGSIPEYRKHFEAWEEGSESAVENQTNLLLEAADYSPEIEPSKSERKTARIFELRVYHSPTYRQLGALHERFAGPEIRIFHRHGIHPLFYTSTLFGASIPNLTYLIPFESLADREKAWAAFGADPEWTKVRADSIARSGQVSSVMQISLYKAAPYSPIQ